MEDNSASSTVLHLSGVSQVYRTYAELPTSVKTSLPEHVILTSRESSWYILVQLFCDPVIGDIEPKA